jgi:hypothetical protein
MGRERSASVADDSDGAPVDAAPGDGPAAAQLALAAEVPLAGAGGAPGQQELQPEAPDALALRTDAARLGAAVAAAEAAPGATLPRPASPELACGATTLKLAQELEACVHWGQLVPTSGQVQPPAPRRRRPAAPSLSSHSRSHRRESLPPSHATSRPSPPPAAPTALQLPVVNLAGLEINLAADGSGIILGSPALHRSHSSSGAAAAAAGGALCTLTVGGCHSAPAASAARCASMLVGSANPTP